MSPPTAFPLPRPVAYKLPFQARELTFDSVLLMPCCPTALEEQENTPTTTGWTEADMLEAFNTFDAFEMLEEIHGMSDVVAHMVVKTREERGPFYVLDELVRVPGFGSNRFLKIVGRKSRYESEGLRYILRWPASRGLLVRDLQPLQKQMRGFLRIVLGPASAGPLERRRAKELGSRLQTRPVHGWRLSLHVDPAAMGDPYVKWVLAEMPAALRAQITHLGYKRATNS